MRKVAEVKSKVYKKKEGEEENSLTLMRLRTEYFPSQLKRRPSYDL